jgi:hypothetical protein
MTQHRNSKLAKTVMKQPTPLDLPRILRLKVNYFKSKFFKILIYTIYQIQNPNLYISESHSYLQNPN